MGGICFMRCAIANISNSLFFLEPEEPNPIFVVNFHGVNDPNRFKQKVGAFHFTYAAG